MKTIYVKELRIIFSRGAEIIVFFPFGSFDDIFDRRFVSFYSFFVGIYGASALRHFIVYFSQAGILGRKIVSTLKMVKKELSE